MASGNSPRPPRGIVLGKFQVQIRWREQVSSWTLPPIERNIEGRVESFMGALALMRSDFTVATLVGISSVAVMIFIFNPNPSF
jgi:hypothetical protein